MMTIDNLEFLDKSEWIFNKECPKCGIPLLAKDEFGEYCCISSCDYDNPLVIYFKEGALVGCSIKHNFINPAESTCGYGNTEEEALEDLKEMLNK